MNQENKQLPTASQSLYKWNFKLVHEDMAKCIDEHTRLHTAPLREELEKLRAENDRLENIISGYTSSLKDYDVERKHLINENQKLREALEDIASDRGDYLEIAKEALKGLGQ